MYEGMQGQAGPQGAGPDMSGFAGAGSADAGASAGTGAADDIIDGDFKEI
jgi:molecular chaperone DnaK